MQSALDPQKSQKGTSMWLALAVYTLVARSGKNGGSKPCQTLAFRAMNISPERTGRGKNGPRSRKGKQNSQKGFNRFKSDRSLGLWRSPLKDKYTRSTRSGVHVLRRRNATTRPLFPRMQLILYFTAGPKPRQNAKSGSIKTAAASTHSPRRNKITYK